MKKSRHLLALAAFAFAGVFARAATPAPSATAARPLAVGIKAPSAVLTDVDGGKVDLAAALDGKLTVLVFYRGSWCPFCNRQLAALGELEPKLLALGFQILAVSPDTAEGLKKMAGDNHLSYRLLSDHAMVASAAYGVAFRLSPDEEKGYRGFGVELTPVPGGGGFWLPVPTVFLVGRDRAIRFVYSNPDFKIRLSNADLLTAAESVAK